MIVANEFARPIRLDTLGDVPREVTIEAEADERAALARRFGLVSVEHLSATALLSRTGEVVFADGRLEAAVVQSCAASGAPVSAQVFEPFRLRFEPPAASGPDEMELGEHDLDVIAYAGGAIDLGEAAAETLGLALDPFPRAPDADERLREAGALHEGGSSAFAALKDLKDRLAGS